jgi:hypothetical protein
MSASAAPVQVGAGIVTHCDVVLWVGPCPCSQTRNRISAMPSETAVRALRFVSGNVALGGVDRKPPSQARAWPSSVLAAPHCSARPGIGLRCMRLLCASAVAWERAQSTSSHSVDSKKCYKDDLGVNLRVKTVTAPHGSYSMGHGRALLGPRRLFPSARMLVGEAQSRR